MEFVIKYSDVSVYFSENKFNISTYSKSMIRLIAFVPRSHGAHVRGQRSEVTEEYLTHPWALDSKVDALINRWHGRAQI